MLIMGAFFSRGSVFLTYEKSLEKVQAESNKLLVSERDCERGALLRPIALTCMHAATDPARQAPQRSRGLQIAAAERGRLQPGAVHRMGGLRECGLARLGLLMQPVC